MSNTPRTDAATVEVDVAFVGHDGLSSSPQRYVEVEFAQQLERELAALVRDAKRFRKLEQAHDCTSAQVRGIGIPDAQWCERYRDMYIASSGALADVADALPDVEP